MQRFLALIVLVIPAVFAGYGIKLMRDTVFHILNPPYPFLMLQFFAGMVALILGVWFIGGFILHRDRKNNKVAPRFQLKQNNSAK
ncbi:hypothetical protein CR205_08250 [Alteribacter lacisalsi]|uniref:DUF2627 domain-containing protein n=1 Tax=Alteribacter lacisalsi TaxID=2045244 RepID=A0A2W0HZE1_9BACI|nr:DUF2627 domain-containing protein [Alteribacter lacisalsi]PYZ99198.1 hypothetical protein CR205_08250 [Alteribacter lacisalsi]